MPVKEHHPRTIPTRVSLGSLSEATLAGLVIDTTGRLSTDKDCRSLCLAAGYELRSRLGQQLTSALITAEACRRHHPINGVVYDKFEGRRLHAGFILDSYRAEDGTYFGRLFDPHFFLVYETPALPTLEQVEADLDGWFSNKEPKPAPAVTTPIGVAV